MKLVADGVAAFPDAVSNISDSVSWRIFAEGVGNRFHQGQNAKEINVKFEGPIHYPFNNEKIMGKIQEVASKSVL